MQYYYVWYLCRHMHCNEIMELNFQRVMLCCAVLRCVALRCVMLCFVMLCYVMLLMQCNILYQELYTILHKILFRVSHIYIYIYCNELYITLGSHSGVSVRRASGQDSCSEEPGRLAAPQLRKWNSAARHDHRFVAGHSRREREFAYQIPRFN